MVKIADYKNRYTGKSLIDAKKGLSKGMYHIMTLTTCYYCSIPPSSDDTREIREIYAFEDAVDMIACYYFGEIPYYHKQIGHDVNEKGYDNPLFPEFEIKYKRLLEIIKSQNIKDYEIGKALEIIGELMAGDYNSYRVYVLGGIPQALNTNLVQSILNGSKEKELKRLNELVKKGVFDENNKEHMQLADRLVFLITHT